MWPTLHHFEAEVIGEPHRTAEQRIHGSGWLGGHSVAHPTSTYGTIGHRRVQMHGTNHVVIPTGRFAIDTEYRYRCDFWVRFDYQGESGETQIVMDEEVPPVREGQSLVIIFARCGRRVIPVGFVNRTTGRHHRLLTAEIVLRYFRLPVEESWREVEPVRPEALAVYRRQLAEGRQTGSMVGVGALCACGLGFAITIYGLANKAGGATAVGVIILLAAIVTAVLAFAYLQGTNVRKPRGLETTRYRNYTGAFDRQYGEYVSQFRRPSTRSIP